MADFHCVRRVLWFLVGVLLAANAVIALAAEMNTGLWYSNTFTNSSGSCEYWRAGKTEELAASNLVVVSRIVPIAADTCKAKVVYCTPAYPNWDGIEPDSQTVSKCSSVCPAGTHMQTFTGVGDTYQKCVPDCPAGQVNDPNTGQCGCPAGGPPWNEAAQSCSCPAGSEWNSQTQSCGDYCASHPYLNSSGWSSVDEPGETTQWLEGTGWPAPSTVCISDGAHACSANVSWEFAAGGSGKYYGKARIGVSTGESCGVVTETPDTPEKDCLDKGLVPGYVNGNVVCVQAATSEKTTETTTQVTNEQGQTSQTTTKTTTTQDAANNKTTTTTTTTGDAGTSISMTTTSGLTESAGGGGAGGGSGGPCVQTPSGCQESGWAGNCDAGFSCDGDAVQCAVARGVWDQRCKELANETAAQDYMTGQGLVHSIPAAKLAAATNSDGSGDVNMLTKFQDAQQNYLEFAAECLPPLSFTFKGHTYTFNTQPVCEVGGFVKMMLHLVAYMFLLKILDNAFRG